MKPSVRSEKFSCKLHIGCCILRDLIYSVFTIMTFRLIFLLAVLLFIAACGEGSSTSNDIRARQASFVGTQTITLSNGEASVSEQDEFLLNLNEDIVTIVDENFNATSQLDLNNQFSLSSPIFSTSADGVTCTGSVIYSGLINGDQTSGDIQGEFNCSGVIFDVSGSFSGGR